MLIAPHLNSTDQLSRIGRYEQGLSCGGIFNNQFITRSLRPTESDCERILKIGQHYFAEVMGKNQIS